MEKYLYDAFNQYLIRFLEENKNSNTPYFEESEILKDLFEENIIIKIGQFIDNEDWETIWKEHKPEEE